jgi:hypothetical protein
MGGSNHDLFAWKDKGNRDSLLHLPSASQTLRYCANLLGV